MRNAHILSLLPFVLLSASCAKSNNTGSGGSSPSSSSASSSSGAGGAPSTSSSSGAGGTPSASSSSGAGGTPSASSSSGAGGGDGGTFTCTQVNQGVGCCVGNTLYYCKTPTSTLTTTTCSGGDICAWKGSSNYYDCVMPPTETDGGADAGEVDAGETDGGTVCAFPAAPNCTVNPIACP
jgi:hypothetical protein